MSTSNRVIKNTGYLYAKMGITMFISLYTTRLILNSLGATDFGIFNIVGGAIAMLGFLNGAMAGATQRFMSYAEGEGRKDKQKSIFNVSVVLHFCIAILLGIVLLIAGYFFFDGILNIPADRIHAAKMIYYFMIASTMLTVMTVPYDAVLNAHENMLYYSLVGIVESVLKLAVAFIVVYTLSDKLIIYGALMAAISLVVMVIMRVYCKRKYEECIFAPRKYWSRGMMKEMTFFAGWSFLGSMSSLVGNYGYGIVVNHFFGVILNAAMGIVNQLNGQLMVFSNSMMKALNPVITKSEGSQDRDSMIRYSFIGCKFSFLLLAFIAVPVLIEAPFILKIWLKNVPEWTVLFLRLQVIRTLLELLTSGLGTALSAEGHIKNINISSVITNLLHLPILWVMFKMGLPPYWLFIVVIITMTIGGNLFKLYYSHIYCNIQYSEYFRKVVSPCMLCLMASTIIGYLPYQFLSTGWIRLVLCTLCSLSTFILLIYWKILNQNERENILKLKSKLTNIKGR